MRRKIKDHKWRCSVCRIFIGEDYEECPVCSKEAEIEDIRDQVENIKDECVSCGKRFKNSKRYFKQSGNFCRQCMSRIEAKVRWFRLKNRIIKLGRVITKAELEKKKTISIGKVKKSIKKIQEDLDKLKIQLSLDAKKILKLYDMDIVEEYNDFNSFRKIIYERLMVKGRVANSLN